MILKSLSLKLRLLAIIFIIHAVGSVIAAYYVLTHARAAIHAEIQSTLDLTREFIKSSRSLTPKMNTIDSYDHLVRALNSIRHIKVYEAYLPPTITYIDEPLKISNVPNWFVSMVHSVTHNEERLVIQLAANRSLVIAADPADEIREVWADVYNLSVLTIALIICLMTLVYFAIQQALRPIDNLLLAFERLATGDLNVNITEPAAPELHRIHRKFNYMTNVLRDTVEHNRLLSSHLVSVQEKERRNLARELHDDIAPYLFDIKVQTTLINKLADHYPQLKVTTYTSGIEHSVEQLQQLIRSILHRLRPLVLDDLGLAQSLAELVKIWNTRYPNTHWQITINHEMDDYNDMLRVSIYRIIQECMTNIARHASAQQGTIQIDVITSDELQSLPNHNQSTRKNVLKISVTDDGIGMSMTRKLGLGLTGIVERVTALGGNVDITTAEGQGFSLTALIPLKAEYFSNND